MASRMSPREEMQMTEMHSLQKTREKLTAALAQAPDARKIKITRKTAASIAEYLYRLADLEK